MMPMREVHLRRYQITIAFLLLLLAATVGIWRLQNLQHQANDSREVICEQTKLFITSSINLQGKTLDQNAKIIVARTNRIDAINGLVSLISDAEAGTTPKQRKSFGFQLILQFRIFLRAERAWLLEETVQSVGTVLNASATADKWRKITNRLRCDELGG